MTRRAPVLLAVGGLDLGRRELVTGVRPARCAIVTIAQEPAASSCRHNSMLNTRGLTGRYSRTGRTTHRASAGLMIGGALLGAGMFLAGCSASGASSAASSSGVAGRAGYGPAAAPAPIKAAGVASGAD